ncbi:MAG: hypothetical protein INQ03_25245 [Candidatus Heimdallarchaeota archaeon]|nr:hypothetical protein [Candidatus Heimdallarchaeota archaeon]
MTFYLDIVIFGYLLFENVPFSEEGVALAAILSGLTLRLISTNVSSRDDETAKIDVFFGTGFTALFKRDMSYIINPLKQMIKLQGPYVEYLVSFLLAGIFPIFGPALVDTASLQEYLFYALCMGYAVNKLILQFTETLDQYIQSLKQLNAFTQLIDAFMEEAQ